MNNKQLLKSSLFISTCTLTPVLLVSTLLSGCYPAPSQQQSPVVVDQMGQHQASKGLGYYPTGKSPNYNPNSSSKPVYQPAYQPSQPSYQPPYQPSYQPNTGTNPTSTTHGKGYSSFAQWKADFTRRAVAQGYNANDIQRLLAMAQYSSRTVSLDSNQAEFVKMPWQYVEKAVSDSRVRIGRNKYSTNATLLSRIKQTYNVSPYIVTAIWGMESGYGSVTGNSNLASSLASLAYDGRRRAFAEKQLLSLLTLVNRSDVSWGNMKGSWAGGMGHTQFIPATWLVQGVDGNYDGKRSPWSKADALASTASYLHNSGWVEGLPTFIEVKLPAQFNYQQAGMRKSMGQWRSLGVQPIMGHVNNAVNLKLWLPAGQYGPALLLTRNFDVIKRYNNSSNYALAVSLLAKEIAYQGGLTQAWPKYERPLTKYQVKQLQQRLTSLGFDTKGVDGVIGLNTRKAFQRWQATNGYVADGFICQRTAQPLIY